MAPARDFTNRRGAVEIVVPREELERRVMEEVLRMYPGVERLDEESRRRIAELVRYELQKGWALRYAYGICRAFGAVGRECLVGATARYIAAALARPVIELLVSRGAA
jgi:hypothetical protein